MQPMFYIYVYRLPDGTPVYVGKGFGKRDLSHLKAAAGVNGGTFPSKVPRWLRFLSARVREGVVFSVERLEDNIEEEGLAFLLEMDWIAFYGRLGVEPGGTLLNTDEGGRAQSKEDARRRASSPVWRRQKSEEMLAFHADPKRKVIHLAKLHAVIDTPEHRSKIAEGNRRRAQTLEYKAAVKAAAKVWPKNPQWREGNLTHLRNLHQDQKWRDKISALSQAAVDKRRADTEGFKAFCEKMSAVAFAREAKRRLARQQGA